MKPKTNRLHQGDTSDAEQLRDNPVREATIDKLRKIIESSPSGELTFLVTDFRRPFSTAGFGNKFRYWCDQAGLPHCSAHGLRKAAATRLAELGASEHEIMAVTGRGKAIAFTGNIFPANRAMKAGLATSR
jgi:integrase